MAYFIPTAVEDVAPAEVAEVDLYHPKSFVTKYVFSQDAKVIAIQYSFTAIAIGLVALVLSWPVGEAMEHGADNDLLDRLAGHDSFAAVDRAALEAELDPTDYVGRCPEQVEEFIRGPLAALLGSIETFTVEKAEVMV